MQLPRHWRQRPVRYRLEGQRNRHTGEIRFPPQPAALAEAPDTWEPAMLSGRGEIYSFSGVRTAPSGYDQHTPYLVALVKLEEGPLVTAQLTDCSEQGVQIGMPVEMVTRRLTDLGEDGLLIYGYKFRPVLS